MLFYTFAPPLYSSYFYGFVLQISIFAILQLVVKPQLNAILGIGNINPHCFLHPPWILYGFFLDRNMRFFAPKYFQKP